MIMLPKDFINSLNHVKDSVNENPKDEFQTATIEFIEVKDDNDFFIYVKEHQ